MGGANQPPQTLYSSPVDPRATATGAVVAAWEQETGADPLLMSPTLSRERSTGQLEGDGTGTSVGLGLGRGERVATGDGDFVVPSGVRLVSGAAVVVPTRAQPVRITVTVSVDRTTCSTLRRPRKQGSYIPLVIPP